MANKTTDEWGNDISNASVLDPADFSGTVDKPVAEKQTFDEWGNDISNAPVLDFSTPWTPPKAEPEGRTVGGTLKDIALTAAKSVIGVGEFPIGLADMVTGGYVGRAAEKYAGWKPKQAKEILSSYYSEPQQRANLQVEQAKGFVDIFKTAIQNPSVVAHTALESIPLMLGGAGIARIIQKGVKISPWVAAAVGEGLVASGMMAESIRQETGRVTAKQALMSAGAGLGTGMFNIVGSRLASKFGLVDIDDMLAGAKTSVKKEVGEGFAKNAKDVAGRLIKGGIAEGFFEELPQSIQEQIWSNAALGLPLGEGVPNAAAMGLLTGMTMGAGANVFAPKYDPIQEFHTTNQKINDLESNETRSEKQDQELSELYKNRDDLSLTPEIKAAKQADIEIKVDALSQRKAELESIEDKDAAVHTELQEIEQSLAEFQKQEADTTENEKRFEENPLDDANNAEFLDKTARQASITDEVEILEGAIPTTEEAQWEKDIEKQIEKKEAPKTRVELNQEYIDNIDAIEKDILAGRVTPEAVKALQDKRQQLEDSIAEQEEFDRQEAEIKAQKATPAEIRQARIKAAKSDIEKLEVEEKQAVAEAGKDVRSKKDKPFADENAAIKAINEAGKGETHEPIEINGRWVGRKIKEEYEPLGDPNKIEAMQAEVLGTEPGGVTQLHPEDPYGDMARYKATSPAWMAEIQQGRKDTGLKALSRDGLYKLLEKARTGQAMTAIQREDFTLVQKAINEYQGEAGEFQDITHIKALEKEVLSEYPGLVPEKKIIEKSTEEMPKEYPIAPKDKWYGDADYKQRGGEIVKVSPDKYLESAKPLEMDSETRENVDLLKEHIVGGKELDPLALYGLDKTSVRDSDGRHRAIASKELGIKEIPVIDFTGTLKKESTKIKAEIAQTKEEKIIELEQQLPKVKEKVKIDTTGKTIEVTDIDEQGNAFTHEISDKDIDTRIVELKEQESIAKKVLECIAG